MRSALTRRPPRSYPPSSNPATALPETVRRRDSVHGPTLATGGDASRPTTAPAGSFPLPGWKNSAGSDPATGVTKERPSCRETAGFVGVAPGITGGALSARPVCHRMQSVQPDRRCPGNLRGHGVIRVVTRVVGSNHVPARRKRACRARRTVDRDRLRRGKWSAASSDNCPLWSARGAGVQAEAPRSGGECSERLDAGEHGRNDELSDDAVGGRQRCVGKVASGEHPRAGMHEVGRDHGGSTYSLKSRGESPLSQLSALVPAAVSRPAASPPKGTQKRTPAPNPSRRSDSRASARMKYREPMGQSIATPAWGTIQRRSYRRSAHRWRSASVSLVWKTM